MNRPFFSVLIPVYNVEKYLSTCLESVLRQSFTDYEIILVDDGSKDSSGQICDEYATCYPDRIRVHHKPNQGQLSARVAGLQLANGHYICFLDSDDCWLDNTLIRLHEVIETTNSDVVIFEWKRIDDNGKELNTTEKALFPQSGFLDKNTIFESMLSTSSLNSLCKKCCKYELFDVNVDYSHFFRIKNGEDLIQSLPAMYNAKTFYYLNEPLYQYRVNTSSITYGYRSGRHKTINVLRPLLYSYIEKLGLDNPKNKTIFFTTYLRILWDEIVALFTGIPSVKERNAALDELRTYEFVKKGRAYLDICNLPKQVYLGLYVFYKNSNDKMNIYMRLYLPVIKSVRGAKAALRKLIK